jgi:flagellar basal body-associated protein FliL
MMENKIKKDKFIIFVVIIVVLVILLSAFWIIPQIHPSSTRPVTGPISTLTQSVAGYYLQYSPLLYYGFDSNVSRIFVVSANAS